MEGKRPDKHPVILTKEEAKQLLAQPNRRYPTGLRNYTMLMLMYYAGLRVSEVLKLRKEHILPATNQIFVEDGKGKRDRYIYVAPWLIDAILMWHVTRKQLPGDRDLLFVTLKGEPIIDRYIRQMVKREAKAAGIKKNIHPHSLRHTYATELLEEGRSIIDVQNLLGHAFVTTTQRYTHIRDNELGEWMAKRKPL